MIILKHISGDDYDGCVGYGGDGSPERFDNLFHCFALTA
jgi:hypothetical protein